VATWLMTCTFYGQWLPGDSRGSVTSVRDRRSNDRATTARIEHAEIGEDFEDELPGLRQAAKEQLREPPVAVELLHAEQLLVQFQETSTYRGWNLLAVSVMHNHSHVVVETPSSVGKKEILRDFKSYGSRRLNRLFGKRISGSWWTHGGSCRPIRDLPPAIHYVCHRQPNPLLVWSLERGRIPPTDSHPDNKFNGK
jgi:REP element-mobilizing transposase RayT